MSSNRKITSGEIALLIPLFGVTLPYGSMEIGINEKERGGKHNSMTPGTIPWMAKSIFRADYSAKGVLESDTWVFIHEMVHVWQAYRVGGNVGEAIKLWFKHKSYEDSYDYDLDSSGNYFKYNLEQQASIVPDYWYIDKGFNPIHNKGTKRSKSDYEPFLSQLLSTGPVTLAPTKIPAWHLGGMI